MEVVIPPERLERVLGVVMHQRNYTLAAFEFKEVARQLMGVSLPTLEKVEVEAVKPPIVSQPVAQPKPELAVERPVAETPVLPVVPNHPPMGQLEKRILRFLRNAGIEQDIMTSQDFHLRIENEPFIPLVVERQGDELYLTHYLTQNGDMFIDSEMVFRVRGEGHIEFKETAVQSLRGGESRLPDRAFAQIFSKNIVQQGFAESAKAQIPAQAAPEVEVVSPQEPEADRASIREDIRQYLEVKDQYPEAIVLVKSPDQQFYEAFFEGAQPLMEHLEMIATRVESGVKEMGRVLAAGFPVRSLHKYLDMLTQHGEVVIAEGEGAIAIHPHQLPEPTTLEAPAQNPVEPIPQPQTPAPASKEPEFQVQNLFDLDQFSGTHQNGHKGRQTTDPAWTDSAGEPQSIAPASEVITAQTTKSLPAPTVPEVAEQGQQVNEVVPESPAPLQHSALDTLRDWYRAARDLGHDPLHLEQIKQLGLSAKQANGNGFGLPPNLQQAMAQDLVQYQALQQRGEYVAQASQKILSVIGQTRGPYTQFRGKVYELKQTVDRLTVRRVIPQPQTILEMAQGKIQRTVVTAEDCQRFQRFVQRLESDRVPTPTSAGLER
jgi:hypothetical protein